MRNRKQDIKDARFWAEEFLRRLDTFEESEPDFMSGKKDYFWTPNHNWAAVKRTSLDLSKSLTNLRKSVYGK